MNRKDQNIEQYLFEEVKNAPAFSSEKRLKKLLYICCGKNGAMRGLVKLIARDAHKAYLVGIEDGESGKKAIPFVGIDEVSAIFNNAEVGRIITEFIYEAYICGYGVGAEKHKALKEVKK